MSFKQAYINTPGAVLLEVRTDGDFSAGSLPGAINFNFMSAAFAQKIEKLNKNATYFVFCRSGNSSGSACRMMREKDLGVRNWVVASGHIRFNFAT